MPIQKASLKTYALLMVSWALTSPVVVADSTQARCVSYPVDQAAAVKSVLCQFSQRQGFVTVQLATGRRIQLAPIGDRPGNFVDQDGHPVYRQSGLGSEGLIFKLPGETLHVLWNTQAGTP